MENVMAEACGPSPSIESASSRNLSKEHIEQERKKLQALLHTLGGGISSNILGVGIFAHVFNLGDGRVRKVPSPHPGNLDHAVISIRRECEIYELLGDHPRVVKCLTTGDLFVDLEFAPNGHVEDYIKHHPDITDKCRIQFAHEVIEAVAFIHSKGVIHADLAARQFLLDDALHVRICDFGFSGFSGGADVIGFESWSHHLPREIDGEITSSFQSDLFALGSTLYEIMTGKRSYEGKSDVEIERLYSSGSFPDVAGILGGHVIIGCWKSHFKSAAEVQGDFLVAFPVTNI